MISLGEEVNVGEEGELGMKSVMCFLPLPRAGRRQVGM